MIPASPLSFFFPSRSCQRAGRRVLGAGLYAAGLTVAWMAAVQVQAQTQGQDNAETRQGGLLGDDFARDTGAIIVTGQRLGESNLFEPVEHPDDSCLTNAPRLGESEPGFTIDASGLTKVRQLERIRRKTRAGTIFVSGGNFVGANFRKAKLYNICFFGSDLSQTDWTGLSAQGLGFVNVDLTGAKMQRTHLPSVLFRDVKLGLVDASGARWMRGRLDGGWDGSLRELDLTNADLTDFRFVCGTSADDGCPIERNGMSMKGTNLRRASLHSFYVNDLDLAGARIDQTELSLDHLRLLDQTRLAGPIVLRSLRRAVMLFPAEAAQLTKVAESAEGNLDVCANAAGAQDQTPGQDGPQGVLAVMCAIPGSETRELLSSVALLEREAQGTEDYQRRRRAWAAGRDACMDFTETDQQVNCITSAYRSRQTILRASLGRPGWLMDQGYRLFLSREAAFPTDKGEPGLYGRVLPVLLDTAVAAVIVRSDGQGSIDAKGVAVDGCYFEQENLAYNIEQAQLGFAAENRQRRRRRRSAPPKVEDPLIAISGRSASVEDRGLVRAAGGCGVDNPFPRLEEIELDDRLLATIWERF